MKILHYVKESFENNPSFVIKMVSSDFSNVTDASHMFRGCESLTQVSSDFSNVTDARFMFAGCTSLATKEK